MRPIAFTIHMARIAALEELLLENELRTSPELLGLYAHRIEGISADTFIHQFDNASEALKQFPSLNS